MCVSLRTLLNKHQHMLPLRHMKKQMLLDASKKERLTQYQVVYMSSPGIMNHQTFKYHAIGQMLAAIAQYIME